MKCNVTNCFMNSDNKCIIENKYCIDYILGKAFGKEIEEEDND